MDKSSTDRKWFAFYVKPRHEKKAAGRLSEHFEIFCPLKQERVKWSDRWKTVINPWIPGYLFAKVTIKNRFHILNDPSVFRTVCRMGRPAVIREDEIDSIKRVIGLPGVSDLNMEQITPGDRVTVTGGRLLNLNGVVVMVKGNRAMLKLESLQGNMTFSVKHNLLEIA